MVVKHGGRGPGHLSRWPKAASGASLSALANLIAPVDSSDDPLEEVANRNTEVATSNSIVLGPQAFDAQFWPNVSSGVARTGLFDDEAGGKLGVRVQMSDGQAIRYVNEITGLQQTMRFRAKSNSGSAHNVVVGSWFVSGQRATVSVGTDWTTVEVTMASGNHYLWIGAVGNAVDIIIDGGSFSTIAGATAYTPPAPAGHLYNGNLSTTSTAKPAKATARAFVPLSTVRSRFATSSPITSDDFCVAFAVRQTAASSGSTGMLCSVWPSNTAFQVRTTSDRFALSLGGAIQDNFYPFDTVNRGWTLFALQINPDTGSQQIFINGDLHHDHTWSPTLQTCQLFELARFGTASGPFPGDVGETYIFDRALTLAEHRLLFNEWKDEAGAVSYFEPGNVCAAIGDSITGNKDTWVDAVASNLISNDIVPIKAAISGQILADLTARLDQYASFAVAGRPAVATVMVGFNDFSTGTYTSASDYWTDYKVFLDALLAAGYEDVIVITNTPTTNGPVSTLLDSLATLIRADSYTVCDLRADSAAGVASNPSDYPDGLHPSTARAAIIGDFIDDYILAAFS